MESCSVYKGASGVFVVTLNKKMGCPGMSLNRGHHNLLIFSITKEQPVQGEKCNGLVSGIIF